MAVFTLLCHVSIDCNSVDLLYSPTLLKLLGDLQHNTQATDEDRQLAHFVTSSFLNDLDTRREVRHCFRINILNIIYYYYYCIVRPSKSIKDLYILCPFLQSDVILFYFCSARNGVGIPYLFSHIIYHYVIYMYCYNVLLE